MRMNGNIYNLRNIGDLELLLKYKIIGDLDLEFDSSNDTWEVNSLFTNYHYPSSHPISNEHDPINELSTNKIVWIDNNIEGSTNSHRIPSLQE